MSPFLSQERTDEEEEETSESMMGGVTQRYATWPEALDLPPDATQEERLARLEEMRRDAIREACKELTRQSCVRTSTTPSGATLTVESYGDE